MLVIIYFQKRIMHSISYSFIIYIIMASLVCTNPKNYYQQINKSPTLKSIVEVVIAFLNRS